MTWEERASMRKLLTTLGLTGLLVLVGGSLTSVAQEGPPDKVTICHIAGLAAPDNANEVTLTIPWVAVYGQAGHFNENGTTQAGHEEDYFGPCVEAETPPTVPPTVTPPTDVPPTPDVAPPSDAPKPPPPGPPADPDLSRDLPVTGPGDWVAPAAIGGILGALGALSLWYARKLRTK